LIEGKDSLRPRQGQGKDVQGSDILQKSEIEVARGDLGGRLGRATESRSLKECAIVLTSNDNQNIDSC
jgi:hypothetical protein